MSENATESALLGILTVNVIALALAAVDAAFFDGWEILMTTMMK